MILILFGSNQTVERDLRWAAEPINCLSNTGTNWIKVYRKTLFDLVTKLVLTKWLVKFNYDFQGYQRVSGSPWIISRFSLFWVVSLSSLLETLEAFLKGTRLDRQSFFQWQLSSRSELLRTWARQEMPSGKQEPPRNLPATTCGLTLLHAVKVSPWAYHPPTTPNAKGKQNNYTPACVIHFPTHALHAEVSAPSEFVCRKQFVIFY